MSNEANTESRSGFASRLLSKALSDRAKTADTKKFPLQPPTQSEKALAEAQEPVATGKK